MVLCGITWIYTLSRSPCRVQPTPYIPGVEAGPAGKGLAPGGLGAGEPLGREGWSLGPPPAPSRHTSPPPSLPLQPPTSPPPLTPYSPAIRDHTPLILPFSHMALQTPFPHFTGSFRHYLVHKLRRSHDPLKKAVSPILGLRPITSTVYLRNSNPLKSVHQARKTNVLHVCKCMRVR